MAGKGIQLKSSEILKPLFLHSLNGYTAPPLSRLSEVDDELELTEIEKLSDDLERCKQEKEMMADQLNCFIILVRKALSRDSEALEHVKKIAGVEGSFECIQSEIIAETANPPKVKIRAIKNWGILAASLLHQDYNTRMTQLREISQERLAYRNQLLDKVQMQHIEKFNTGGPALRPKSGRPQSGKSKGPGITATDLFETTGESGFQSQAMDALYNKTVKDHQQYKSNPPPYKSEFKGSYADPNRYAQKGLFDSSGVVKKSRPTSANSLKSADAKRARPKSAVISSGEGQRTERPLKYETTRPVSSKPKKSERTTAKITPNKVSPKSEKPKQRDPISEFTDELGAMGDLEQQFRTTTLTLQKKIGIRPDGFIG